MPADTDRDQEPRRTRLPTALGATDPRLVRALSSLGAILLEIAGNAPGTSRWSQRGEEPHESVSTQRKQET